MMRTGYDGDAWYWAFHCARVAEVYEEAGRRDGPRSKKAWKARYIGATGEGHLLIAIGRMLAQRDPFT